MSRKKCFRKKKIEYPIIQGTLTDDSLTKICNTGVYKTTFNLNCIESQKEIPCVFWSNLIPILKGEMVIVEGFMSKKCFICKDVKKINVPYSFN